MRTNPLIFFVAEGPGFEPGLTESESMPLSFLTSSICNNMLKRLDIQIPHFCRFSTF